MEITSSDTKNITENDVQLETDLFIPSQAGDQQEPTTGSKIRQIPTERDDTEEDKNYGFFEQLKIDVSFRGRVIHTVWLCVAFIGLGSVVGQIGPSFPDLRLIVKQELDVGSLIFTISSLGYMLGSLVAGFLYDRWNKLFLIIMSIWIMALTSLALPWLRSFPVMLVIRFITGLGCGGLDTVGNADLVSQWDEAGRPYIQALHFCFGLGGIISPLFTEPFLAKKKCISNNTEVNYNTTTEVPVFNVTDRPQDVCTSFVYEETQIHYAFIITCCFLILSSLPFIKMWIDKLRSKRRHSIHANKDNLDRPDKLPYRLKICLLVLISVMFLVYCAIEDSFGGLMMTFTLNYFKYNKSKGSLATSLYWTTFSIGRFSGIFLIQLFSPVTWLFIFCIMMLFSLFLFAISSLFLIYPLIWISIGLVGFSCSLMFPCLFTWTEESVLKVTGMISSLFLLAASSGLMINPIILALLMDNFTPLWFAYVLFLECLLLFVILSVIFIIVKRYVRPLRESTTETELDSLPVEDSTKSK